MRISPVSYNSYQRPKSKPVASKGWGVDLKKSLGIKLNSDEAIVENLVKKYPDKAKYIRYTLAWEIPEVVLRTGVYGLKKVAEKSQKDKEDVIDILQNLAIVANKRSKSTNLLYGKIGDEEDYPGIITVLEELTGEKVDIDKLVGGI